jgi:hypothetical protein
MESVDILIQAAVIAATERKFEVARSALGEIDFASLVTQRRKEVERVWGRESTLVKPELPPKRITRLPVSQRDMEATFLRDRFTCRYEHCRRRTIHLSVLKAVSRLFPDLLPYKSTWAPIEQHIVYWMWSTSLEHKVSFPFQGTSHADNLVTACYQCNDLKNYLPFETLGWRFTEPATSDWDGLRSYLPKLIAVHRSLQPADAPSSAIAVRAKESIQSVAPSPGCLVRARLPGKKTARGYRVDAISDSFVTLCEMWREEGARIWVASKNPQTVPLPEVQLLLVLRATAPSEGSTVALD